MADKVWIIPALPALSFLLTLAFGKRTPGKGHFFGLAAVGIAFVLSLVTAGQWLARDTAHDAVGGLDDVPAQCATAVHSVAEEEAGAAHEATSNHGASRPTVAAEGEGEGEHFTRPVVRCVDWFTSGDVKFTAGTIVDGQSVMMLVVVTLISLLVHVFSTDYVHGDRRYTHYFAFLSLFTASMLFFVLSDNLLQMIVGWELVGVCSFALIGHWWEEKPNSDAALKAFLTNRVGDMGLLVGAVILFFAGGQRFHVLDINALANSGKISHTLLLIASCCLIAAVMSKSGQFILHTWLPDAMAGPTPVSALIHAATMVVAGIYMVARLYPVFFHGLSIGGSSINLLAVVGSVTGLFGALLGFVQSDIKKTLAYSTVSQLGFMVAALGVGAWTAAMFHLFTHAFFKACLFLGAGSLSHACHHSFNMVDDMGGLRKIMPKTFATYVIAMLSLAGFPLVTAGFWSKDEILAGTGGMNDANGTYYFVLVMLLLGAFCTAAYMTRTVWYAFFGEFRGHGHPHESGPRITIPLIVLSVLAVVAGFVNLPEYFSFLPESALLRFEHAIEPVGVFFPGHGQGFTHAGFNPVLATIATLIGFAGIGLTWAFYTGKLKVLEGLAGRNKLAGLGKRILVNKYYLDWLYTDVITGFVKGPLARATYWVNQNVLDGIVNGAGKGAVGTGRWVYDKIDQTVVDGSVNGIAGLAGATGGGLRKAQSGRVQEYAALFFAAAALLAGVIVVAVGS
ncbi:MAG: NADH-quinone oxidoreductase subunit L [Actinobacteria bacterium]|nr:NADH-quinone oxidoreductase subunit L [Actinomycetota bacterium]